MNVTKKTFKSTQSTTDLTIEPIESKDGYYPLHKAARQRDVQAILDQVEHGVDVNVRTRSGKTALHLMVLANDRRMVDALISFGATVTLRDNAGKMPIDYWESGNDIHILQVLQACERTVDPPFCPRWEKFRHKTK